MNSKEQQSAIEAAVQGYSTEIISLAGGGKTRTATEIANEIAMLNKTMGMFYFGNANAKEANIKLKNNKLVKATTFHAHAMKYVDKRIIQRRGRLLWWDLAKTLKVSQKTAYYAIKMVDTFCKTADSEISKKHLRLERNNDGTSRDENLISKEQVLQAAKKLWDMQTDVRGSINTDFHVYLKIWALQNNTIDKEVILIDEFQDTSAVNIGQILKMQKDGIQIIPVGDPNQSIMQFTGANNAFKHVQTDKTVRLTKSYRNGQEIVDLSSNILNDFGTGEQYYEFTGLDNNAKVKRLRNPAAFIARTNATIITELLTQIDAGARPYIVGGAGNLVSLIKSCEKLQQGSQPLTGELSSFKTWEELLEYSESEIGRSMNPLVSAVKEYGTEHLEKAISSVKFQRQATASIILTTAHKSKGLEFPSSQLAGDFKLDRKKEKDDKEMNALSEQSLNAVYVAVTRSLGDTDISNVEYLERYQQ